MPRRSVVRKKKKSPPKYYGKHRWSNYGRGLGQLANDVSMLKGLVNTEFKYLDTSAAPTTNNTGTFVLLNGLQKGDDVNNRDGRSIRIKSLEHRLFLQHNSSSTDSMVRVILFIDKQPNGAAPSSGSVLISGNTITSPRNLEWRKRFVILSDKTYVLSTDGGKYYVAPKAKYLDLDMHTAYSTTDAGTVTDILSNALYMYVLGATQDLTNYPTISYYNRIRFVDN